MIGVTQLSMKVTPMKFLRRSEVRRKVNATLRTRTGAAMFISALEKRESDDGGAL